MNTPTVQYVDSMRAFSSSNSHILCKYSLPMLTVVGQASQYKVHIQYYLCYIVMHILKLIVNFAWNRSSINFDVEVSKIVFFYSIASFHYQAQFFSHVKVRIESTTVGEVIVIGCKSIPHIGGTDQSGADRHWLEYCWLEYVHHLVQQRLADMARRF